MKKKIFIRLPAKFLKPLNESIDFNVGKSINAI